MRTQTYKRHQQDFNSSKKARYVARPEPTSTKELKAFDVDSATYAINDAGTFQLLMSPVLGTDIDDRVGRKTLMKSVYIRGAVARYEALDANPGNQGPRRALQARFILFVDHQPNAAAPATVDLLKQSLVTSQLNLNNRERFTILKDKLFCFDPLVTVTTATQAQAAASNQIQNFKCYKKLNQQTTYNAGNAGTIADINTGALYMFWISNGPIASTPNDGASGLVSTRVRFADD